MKSKSPKLALVFRTHRTWLGNPEKDSPIRNLNDRIIHFLTGLGEGECKPLDSLRGVPLEFPNVTSRDSQLEISGCKEVTHFSCIEIYNLLTRDAMTGETKVTSGITYLDYLGKEFVAVIQFMRVQAVERIIIGFK